MSQKIIKAGLIQIAVSENISENVSKLTSKIREAAAKGAGLVVLQELHNSLYFCQTEDPENFSLAETIPGPSTGIYSNLATLKSLIAFKGSVDGR